MATRAKVNPRTSTPTHTISLSDGVQTVGFRLDGEYKYVNETPQTPSSINIVQQGGEYGDADPSMSHIQQSTWVGGRGNQRFVRDATRFYDSRNMWTISDSVIHAIPQWHFAIGDHQPQNGIQPAKNYQWKSMTGIYYATEFTPAANYDINEIYVWLRKIGNPNELTIGIYSATGNNPNALVSELLLVNNALVGEEPLYLKSTLSTALSVTSGTKYFVVVSGNSLDDSANHWEIMTVNFPHDYAPLTYISADATTWEANYNRLYFRVAKTVTSTLKYKFFLFKDDMYAVQIKTSGTSKLYKLVPTDSTFLWASHRDLVMTEVTSTGLGYVRDVCVVNNVVYFAQGSSDIIRRWNGSSWADDGTNEADIITVAADSLKGRKIYLSIDNYVKTATIPNWGTDLTLDNINDFKNETVTGINGYNDGVWIFTSSGIYIKSGEKNDGTEKSLIKFNANIDDAYNSTNGRASEVMGQYLYVTLDKSICQIYGNNLVDVGYHHGNGLPTDRMGYTTAMRAIFNKMFVAIDGGTTGYSSIMIYDGVNWHELWRSPEKGKSINDIMWYSGKHVTNPLLVWDHGGDIVFMRFPYIGFNPSKDNTMYYAPSASLESSVFDMNQVSLPKMFREVSVVARNMYNTRSDFLSEADNKNIASINVKYHVDADIGTTNYLDAGYIYDSPYGSVMINKSNAYTIQYKVLALTSDAMKPPIIEAIVLKCFARTPIKYQWVMRVKTSSVQSTLTGSPDFKPDFILQWLKEKASSAEIVRMHSTNADLDGKEVIVEPPAKRLDYVDPLQKSWGGVITVVLREA